MKSFSSDFLPPVLGMHSWRVPGVLATRAVAMEWLMRRDGKVPTAQNNSQESPAYRYHCEEPQMLMDIFANG